MRSVALIGILLAAAFAPTSGASDPPQDDCDTGADAPGSQSSAAQIWLHICSGELDGADVEDWIKFGVSGGVGFDVRGPQTVRFCLWVGSSNDACAYGQLDVFVYANEPAYLQMSGVGRYNMTFRDDVPPQLALFACDPSPQRAGQPFRCAVWSRAETTGVRYAVDWGDGSSVDWTSFHWPTARVLLEHTYATPGKWSPRVTTEDNGVYLYPTRAPLSSTATQLLHVFEPGASELVFSAAYRAGTGDVDCPLADCATVRLGAATVRVGVDCALPGCVFFDYVKGETAARIELRDQSGFGVAATACDETQCSSGNRVSFCGSGSLPLPGRSAGTLVVRIHEAFGPAYCGTAIGVGTRGVATVALQAPP